MKKHVFFLFLFLFFSGCRKDKPVEETKYIPQELKDYSYFKKGTWWVYEEETTHDHDSVIVFFNNDSLVYLDGSTDTPAETYEYFDCKTHSNFDDYGYYYSCNTTWTFDNLTPVFRDKTMPGNYVGKTVIMSNKFIIGKKLYPYSQEGIIILMAIYDSLMIQGSNFYNVLKYNDSKNITENDDSTNFYISQNIGIIRKELINKNKVWNLINYHIIQ